MSENRSHHHPEIDKEYILTRVKEFAEILDRTDIYEKIKDVILD